MKLTRRCYHIHFACTAHRPSVYLRGRQRAPSRPVDSRRRRLTPRHRTTSHVRPLPGACHGVAAVDTAHLGASRRAGCRYRAAPADAGGCLGRASPRGRHRGGPAGGAVPAGGAHRARGPHGEPAVRALLAAAPGCAPQTAKPRVLRIAALAPPPRAPRRERGAHASPCALAVSCSHLSIVSAGPGTYLLTDDSTNGTWVDGVRAPRGCPMALRSGCRVVLCAPDLGSDKAVVRKT